MEMKGAYYIMTKRKRLVISLIVVFLIIISLLLIYTFIPYFYAGDFCVKDYQASIEEYNAKLINSSEKTQKVITNAYEASKVVDDLLTKDRLLDTLGRVHTVYYDKVTDVWLVKSWNRFFMLDNTLYEGATTIIDRHGNVLMAYIGALPQEKGI
jgi:hypothetical protein